MFVPVLAAEVVGPAGEPVRVTGRGEVTVAPAQLSVDGGRWTPVTGWAGPWPADERWWDTAAHRRRARFQIVAGDTAWLLAPRATRRTPFRRLRESVEGGLLVELNSSLVSPAAKPDTAGRCSLP